MAIVVKRISCILRSGPIAAENARKCAGELARAARLSGDQQGALELAVHETVALILSSGPPPPTFLRLVGSTAGRRIRILFIWNGAPLPEGTEDAMPLARPAEQRRYVIRRLVDSCREIQLGKRQGVLLEKRNSVRKTCSALEN